MRGPRLRQLPANRARADIDGPQSPLRLRVRRRTLRSAQVRLAGLPFSCIAFRVDATLLERLDVIKARRRVERPRKSIRRSILRRADLRARWRGLLVGKEDGSPVGSDPAGPRQFLDERFGQEQRAVAAIEETRLLPRGRVLRVTTAAEQRASAPPPRSHLT